MNLRLFLLAWILLLLSACAPFAPRTLTTVTQNQAEAWTRPLSDTPLRQTFILPYDQAVSGIEVVLALPDDAPVLTTRPLTWKLVSPNNATVREGAIETATYLHNTPIQIAFAPLPAGESVDLALTAPADAQLSLWRSAQDRYPQGTLVDTSSIGDADLVFTIRAQETPFTLGATLAAEAQAWERAAQWLPLVLLPLGWLLLWLLGNGEGRPRAAAAIGLTLAFIPILYLWFALFNVHLYLPLVRSLLSIAAALTLFIAVRRWRWMLQAWRTISIGSVTVLAFAILLSIGTWLLAGREYLAPPGTDMLESGILAQEINDLGMVPLPTPPLPPAALASFLSTVSQEDVGNLLILSGLLLAVAAVPALFAFAEEITENGEIAVWLLPLAWLWHGAWNALTRGDWFALYSYALMPVAFAMGLRALRAAGGRRRALFLAALPLATLFLVQGLTALLTWALAVATAFLLTGMRNREIVTAPEKSYLPLYALLPRAVAWLFLSFTLLAPTLTQRLPVIAPPSRTLEALGYEYLLLALLLSLALRWLRPRLKPMVYPAYGILVVVLLGLAWWRSAPLPSAAVSLQADEQNVLTWMDGRNTPATTQSLINLETAGGKVTPLDGTFWSPVFNKRHTVYSMRIATPALLSRALAPGALQDALLRDELRRAGITHILLGASTGPLRAADLQNQAWARLSYQSGGAYLFELVSSDPTAQ